MDAFRSTLEEVQHADLMLHVLDAAAPSMPQQRVSVLRVLSEVGVPPAHMEQRMIEVWNKCDRIEGATPGAAPAHHPHAAEVSLESPESPAPAPGSDWGEEVEDEVQLSALVRPGQVARKRIKVEAPTISLARIPRIYLSATQGLGVTELFTLVDRKLGDLGL